MDSQAKANGNGIPTTTKESPEASGYIFTNNWFDPFQPQWQQLISWVQSCSEPINILEIGVNEGRASTWMLDNLIRHPDSTFTAVDTFEDSETIQLEVDLEMIVVSSLEARFRSNVLKTGKNSQVTIIGGKSQEILRNLGLNFKTFDLVYIDGSHDADNVLSDAVLVWPLVKPNGRIIFDDYGWDFFQELYNNPKIAIDSFLKCFEAEIETLEVNYQVTIRKRSKEEAEDRKRTPNPNFVQYYDK